MPKVMRFDAGELKLKKDAWETPEGFLEGFALGTKVGVFPYADEKGVVHYEYRPAEELFKADTLYSMRLIPVTLDHPPDMVNVTNASQFARGYTGTDVRPDGDRIYTDLKVTHADAVQAVKDGKNQVSYGYTVELVQQKGDYKGIPYDFIQTNIHYNHLALVDKARMGPDAKVMTDSGQAGMTAVTDSRTGQPVMRLDGGGNQVIYTHTQKEKIDSGSLPGMTNREETIMPKFKIDGIDYEASQEVINHVTKLQAAHDELKVKADSIPALNTQVQTVTAQRDQFKADLEAEQKKDRSAEVAAAVAERVKLLDAARVTLDAEIIKGLDKMANLDVQKAVILARAEAVKRDALKVTLDAYTPAQVQARFDAAVESIPAADVAALGAQRKAATDSVLGDGSDPIAKAQKDHQDRVLNAWKDKK
jgi:hypothetical protein